MMTTEQKEFLKDIETSDLISYIKENRHRAFISWSTDDVIDQAKGKGFEMSEEKARSVIYDIEHYKDAEYGITWETLSSHVDNWIQENSFEVEVKIVSSGNQYVTKFCSIETNDKIEEYYLDHEYYFYGMSKKDVEKEIGNNFSEDKDCIIIAVK